MHIVQAAHTEIGALQGACQSQAKTLARVTAARAELDRELASVKAQRNQAVWL